jgi:Transcriptional regulator, AbiEi antitoxin, Type IV TA system
MKELEGQAAGALRALIEQVPAIKLKDIQVEPQDADRGVDILAHILVAGRPHVLLCEVKANGQPRHVRMALLQLRNYLAHFGGEATPIFIAPYLSPEAQALCREHEVGFLDLEGNARLVFGGVFIDRLVSNKPPAERRELKSLFKPKSAQVLRVMLRDPRRAWRVAELAAAAGVSLGHVSNVRSGLLDREWAQVSDRGLVLSEPDALLDAWRDAYQPPAGKRIGFYTTLHGSTFEEAARRVLHADPDKGRAIFASFSAAHWQMPYVRTGMQYFYADDAGLEQLKVNLKLSSPSKGENVVVTVLKDDGLFLDTVEPTAGVVCTSPVQSYLDLAAAGERGREAAEHLRQESLRWST